MQEILKKLAIVALTVYLLVCNLTNKCRFIEFAKSSPNKSRIRNIEML